MTSQIPHTPLTPESMGRLTLDEQMAFEAAACAVAGDQKPSLEVVVTLVLTVQRLITGTALSGPQSLPASGDTGRVPATEHGQARERTGAVAGEPLVMPQDELGLVRWLQDALAEAIGPAWGHAAVGSALEAVTPVVEPAARAAAGSHEGIRLWMLDCGSLVQKHREHAAEASARLGEQRERAEQAEARLANVRAYCEGWLESHPCCPEPAADILSAAGTGEQEGDHG